MALNSEWSKVREFHRKFNHPYSDVPVLLDEERKKSRYKWMLEELDEFMEAASIEDEADAMIDLIYFALGTLVESGVKPEALFDIVHLANMSKLWDGTPVYGEDGKIIKPKDWVAPEPLLVEEIRRQGGGSGGA